MLYWTLLLREGERGAGQKPSENAQLNHKVKIKYGCNSVIVVFFSDKCPELYSCMPRNTYRHYLCKFKYRGTVSKPREISSFI